MGARGPKPLPKNVHLLRGNPSRLSPGQMQGGFEPEIEIPDCPKHLLPEARKAWRYYSAELSKYGMIARVDRMALAILCQAWAWWAWHDSLLQRSVKLAEDRRAAFEAAELEKQSAAEARGEQYVQQTWTGGDGFQLPTPNGSFAYNPHWVARNKAAAEVDKYLASFGMSPSSRGRVTPSNRQPYLPGMEPTGGFDAL